MKFSEDYKKLKESSEFNLFKQENPDAFLSGCFFVKDNEAKIETRQIDFFMLHKNKIATFTISNEIFLRIEDQIIIENKRNPLEFIDGIECDFDKIEIMMNEELEKKVVDRKINKIIAVLHNYENKNLWIVTVMLNNFNMLKLKVDADNGEILESKVSNLFDMVRIEKKEK
ncbi:hypothetical protein CO154_02065 [Candidatus Pacearchaeota archaeon CG_4_9_14_3_um_filter_31_7]|nr:MAG: hypothetical protein AUJ10_03565 [Candidatus Pacearchaeota archaeon CG1_02_31_27]PIN91860.1 MAG: hypothetical protein COU55_03720 [Candidatus Pacearchaeota archaeon CG10_big_fil_rev_8_21_14_0_10_31_59]PIZ80513.1 MAG: hypothetical protein COX99_02460 [Candidatus Pacearchaeota archaeon CG_4_10_14_0_2_um_filter_31_10]PJA70596.1 MAG: hypothetical protein CO154_02065 [Candidatus Pacearchaeota archaeon CG_4_9_14_3_um_filter_31_7]